MAQWGFCVGTKSVECNWGLRRPSSRAATVIPEGYAFDVQPKPTSKADPSGMTALPRFTVRAIQKLIEPNQYTKGLFVGWRRESCRVEWQRCHLPVSPVIF